MQTIATKANTEYRTCIKSSTNQQSLRKHRLHSTQTSLYVCKKHASNREREKRGGAEANNFWKTHSKLFDSKWFCENPNEYCGVINDAWRKWKSCSYAANKQFFSLHRSLPLSLFQYNYIKPCCTCRCYCESLESSKCYETHV